MDRKNCELLRKAEAERGFNKFRFRLGEFLDAEGYIEGNKNRRSKTS
jgi:hypothetical protein